MGKYSYEDIGVFLFDDGFYHWIKYGILKDGFDMEAFRDKYRGREDEIEFAAVLIRSLGAVAERQETSEEYKRQRYEAMLARLRNPEKWNPVFRFTRRFFVGAACILSLLLVGIGFYLHRSFREGGREVLAYADVDSLKHCANVRIIVGDDTLLEVKGENAEIKVGKDGALLVDNRQVARIDRPFRHEKASVSRIVVPYGKRSRMILPDSSCVWINSGSCISYRSDFLTDRRLEVEGEVFLDVKKDGKHPFKVESNRLKVCVLGTAFNVKDYADEAASAVVLVRGSVEVKAGDAAERLQPGQCLSAEKDKVRVEEVDVYSYVCWKDNKMNFDNRPLKDIIRNLSRYYNIRIEVSGECADERCSGSLDLGSPFPEVLETVSKVVPFYVERRDNVIYLFTYKDEKSN